MGDGDGNIHVTYSGVQDVSDALSAGTKAIQALLENLEQAIAPLRSSFQGNAAGEYETRKNKWDADAADMGTILGSATQTLDEMAENYSHTDLTLAFQWADLR
jgi:ESAT-6 family protein